MKNNNDINLVKAYLTILLHLLSMGTVIIVFFAVMLLLWEVLIR